MADGLIRRQKTAGGRQRVGAAAPRAFVNAMVFCFLSFVLCPLGAEVLRDPTRPPVSPEASGQWATGRWATRSRPSGLQTTIISRHRRAAIIDGKTVELGEKHGNARLVEVNEGSVVLQDDKTRRVLTLFPDVKLIRKENNTEILSPESGLTPK
jgi:hypothetical protein